MKVRVLHVNHDDPDPQRARGAAPAAEGESGATYVALAEALDTRLVTCDRKLARAPGLSRRVDLVG